MGRLSNFIQRAIRFAQRLIRWSGRQVWRLNRYRSAFRTTFLSEAPQGKLNHYLAKLNEGLLSGQRDILAVLVDQVMAHRFDLLGSGWVNVRHGMVCRGVEEHRYHSGFAVQPDSKGNWLRGRINRTNLAESRRIWSFVDSTYVPIDWQLDFKSGYRWSEKTWHLDIAYTNAPGVDIKVPWELARLQHLPWLGMMQRQMHGNTSDSYANEFRNQILDFIANNPPGFGVNWRCTMDVAIRAANMLLAYDLFRIDGKSFDNEFETVFARSILEHGRHIVSNLEWHEEMRNNHYLANIAGLAFVSAYLPRTAETDAWLAFSTQELVREVSFQFNSDGTNFESSICYHRLSAEIVLFATALLSNLTPDKQAALVSYDVNILRTRPKLQAAPIVTYSMPGNKSTTPFPNWYWERLEKMAEFTMYLTKNDGLAVQVGDNDSGRFFKLGPAMQVLRSDELVSRYINLSKIGTVCGEQCLDGIDLDHRHLVAGINAFFKRQDLEEFSPTDVGADLVSVLSGGIQIASYHNKVAGPACKMIRVGSDEEWSKFLSRLTDFSRTNCCTTQFTAVVPDLRNNMELFGYPDFGAYVFRSPQFFLALRCGRVGKGGLSGHAHLDQLSLELVVDGKTLVSDPGTYLYTPMPDVRNAYRSSRAHFVPHLPGREPGDLSRNVFLLDGEISGECLYFGPLGFVGRHYGFGEAVYRLVVIEESRIVVHDFRESGGVIADSLPNPLAFSPGYGKQYRYQ